MKIEEQTNQKLEMSMHVYELINNIEKRTNQRCKNITAHL